MRLYILIMDLSSMAGIYEHYSFEFNNTKTCRYDVYEYNVKNDIGSRICHFILTIHI